MKTSMTTMNTTHAVGFGVLALVASACAGRISDSDAHDQNAGAGAPVQSQSHELAETVARFELSDGRSVTFLSPAPGFVAVRELGPIGSERLYDPQDTHGMNAVQVYEHLSGEAAPRALVDAVAAVPASRDTRHTNERRVDDELAPVQMPALQSKGVDGIDVSEQALNSGLSPSAFEAAFCIQGAPKPSYWTFVTGTGSVTRYDEYEFSSAALSIRGSIRYVAKVRHWYTWKDLHVGQIPAGWYAYVDARFGNTDFDARATVDQAEGDLYSMCTHF